MKLLFPEPLFDLNHFSLSTFLYFQEEKITLTLHPTVSLLSTGCDPYRFAKLVEELNPKWKNEFLAIFQLWHNSNQMLFQTSELIKPLREEYYQTLWLVYSRNEAALQENDDLIKSTNLSHKELLDIIDVRLASQELIAHLLFEKFLEFYENKLPPREDLISQMRNKSFEESRARNIDYKELFTYCDTLFQKDNIKELLIKSYFYRIKALKDFPDILLSNERLIKFLDKIPVEFSSRKEDNEYYKNIDVIGWEIFRQLTSGYISKISPEQQAQFILQLRKINNSEVLNLKNKCLKLAEDFKGEANLNVLVKNISQHVRINTEKEITELLNIDKNKSKNIINEIFSDEKTWIALGAFVISIYTGETLLTNGAALTAMGNVAAKSFKVASESKKKIKSSDYSLIYRLKNYDDDDDF